MGILAGKCSSQARLDGKTAIITGCNTGIGQYTAMDFYRRGCRVIMACRNIDKAQEAKKKILEETQKETNLGELIIDSLDLSSMQSIRDFAETILKRELQINLLINNAGIMMCPKSFTSDGFEMQFGTNHLGHFLLTLLLLPKILISTPARIVNLSSVAHTLARSIDWDDLNAEKSYSPIGNYCRSKLANVLFSAELARRLEGKNITVYSLHPGVVNTELSRHADTLAFPGAKWLYQNICSFFQKNVKQGAQTTIYCAVEEKLEKETGCYYSDCKKIQPSSLSQNKELASKLWDVSVKLVKLENYDPFTAPLPHVSN